MKRTAVVCGLFLIAALAHAQAPSEAEAQVAARKGALALRDAMLKGDYPTFVDTMPEKLIERLGGRDGAVNVIEKAMTAMKTAGFSISSYTLGEVGKIHKGGDESYVVIPATLELKAPVGRVISETYLLGVSTDQGKTWKYVDGNRLEDKKMRDKLFPDFPASVKLPAKTTPKVLKN